jgi:HAD superfamily hydrolase (TIGR01549 family)
MNKKLIIFDIDGTLINHEYAVEKAISYIYNRFVKNNDKKIFISIWNKKQEKYIKLYLNNEITWDEQRLFRVKESFSDINIKLNDKKAKNIFSIYLNQYENNWKVYKDVIPALKLIKNNVLCIVSNGNSVQQRDKLRKTNISKYFEKVIISEDLNISKPDKRIFEECIKSYDFDNKMIYYVGDNYETDVIGAINANIIPVLINRKIDNDNVNNKNRYFEINTMLNIDRIIN